MLFSFYVPTLILKYLHAIVLAKYIHHMYLKAFVYFILQSNNSHILNRQNNGMFGNYILIIIVIGSEKSVSLYTRMANKLTRVPTNLLFMRNLFSCCYPICANFMRYSIYQKPYGWL